MALRKKGKNNVSNVCGKKIRALQNTNNDVAKCKAGLGLANLRVLGYFLCFSVLASWGSSFSRHPMS